ncbi:hypothetical protein [Sphingopyxis panaciterrae]
MRAFGARGENRAVVEAGHFKLRVAVGDDGCPGAALLDQRFEFRATLLRLVQCITRREHSRDRLTGFAQAVGNAVEEAVERRADDRPAPDAAALFARAESEIARFGLPRPADMREQVRRQGRFARPVAADHGDQRSQSLLGRNQGSKLLPHQISSVP